MSREIYEFSASIDEQFELMDIPAPGLLGFLFVLFR